MNLEQRSRIFTLIQNLEGLLAYAIKTGDEPEILRLRGELNALLAQAE